VWEGFRLVQPSEGMVLYPNIWKCDDVSLIPPLPLKSLRAQEGNQCAV
jgi:hypothetical protein